MRFTYKQFKLLGTRRFLTTSVVMESDLFQYYRFYLTVLGSGWRFPSVNGGRQFSPTVTRQLMKSSIEFQNALNIAKTQTTTGLDREIDVTDFFDKC